MTCSVPSVLEASCQHVNASVTSFTWGLSRLGSLGRSQSCRIFAHGCTHLCPQGGSAGWTCSHCAGLDKNGCGRSSRDGWTGRDVCATTGQLGDSVQDPVCEFGNSGVHTRSHSLSTTKSPAHDASKVKHSWSHLTGQGPTWISLQKKQGWSVLSGLPSDTPEGLNYPQLFFLQPCGPVCCHAVCMQGMSVEKLKLGSVTQPGSCQHLSTAATNCHWLTARGGDLLHPGFVWQDRVVGCWFK